MSEEAATETVPAESQTESLFEPTADDAPAETTPSDRPDWLLDKFNSPEDQAKGYSELYKSYSKKTDDLREEIKTEVSENYAKEMGVPKDIDGYEYPEGWEAPSEALDNTLRTWAKENNIGGDAFQSLIKDVYSQTQTNFEEEKGKLGEKAEGRIEAVNKWITKNIDEQHFSTIRKVMSDAAGVEFFESMIKSTASSGFAPDDVGSSPTSKPLTRESIRNMQADERFGEDTAYTAEVRNKWQQFARQEELKTASRR
mgnify:CR=1 FL=1